MGKRLLYLECSMGAAGDMLMGALLELLPDKQEFLQQMNELGLAGVQVLAEPSKKCGILGTHVRVTVHGEEEASEDVQEHEHERHHHHEHASSHHHFGMAEVAAVLEASKLPERVRQQALEVYTRIGEAEAHVHGVPVEQVHFHEVGALDAVADVAGCCLLLELLQPDVIWASPVHVGSGFVRCAHGILPVPAPATAYLLQGIPMYGGEVAGELCTPTGAALLKHFVTRFGPLPMMETEKIGYGMGNKDFERPNCVRAFWGTAKF